MAGVEHTTAGWGSNKDQGNVADRDVSALGMTVITERNARLAAIATGSTDALTAATSATSRKRRADDEGERDKQARGSNAGIGRRMNRCALIALRYRDRV